MAAACARRPLRTSGATTERPRSGHGFSAKMGPWRRWTLR